jgi:hypothetical protein
MYIENTSARMASHAPRPVWACSGARKPEPKLRRQRTERKLSSSRGEEKRRGRASPCFFERRWKEEVK